MSKIIIHGSTLGSNFGDCLFAQLFYEFCKEHYQGETLFYENKLPIKNDAVALSDDFRKAMHYDGKCTWKDVKTCDGIVFMAGGYFGETTSSLKEALLRHYKHIKLGLYAKWFKKPLAIIGVGAGPISRKFLLRDMVKVCNHADVITVRNAESKTFLEQSGVKTGIIVTADAAQVVDSAYAKPLSSQLEEELLSHCGKRKLVLLHSVTPLAQIATVKEKIVPALENFLKSHDYGVVWTVDQCSADRTEALKDLAKAAGCQHFYLYRYQNPDEMISLLNRVDFVITTKLHVGIVSCSLHKPVVAFPFNSNKIVRYYKQIGCPERCLPIKNASVDEITEKIMQWYDKPVELPPAIREMSKRNFDELQKFMERIDNDKK